MNAKVWIYSCLILSAAGVGVPYALKSGGQAPPPEPLDLPADDFTDAPGAAEELVFASAFEAGAVASVASGAATAQASTASTMPLDSSLARLESFLPRYGNGTLDRMARGESAGIFLGSRAAFSAAAGHDLLQGFLVSNPFSGVLEAPQGAVALFGRRTLQAGDTLFDGQLRVQAIAARSVRFEVDGESVEVQLPPLAAGRRTLGFAAAEDLNEDAR